MGSVSRTCFWGSMGLVRYLSVWMHGALFPVFAAQGSDLLKLESGILANELAVAERYTIGL